MSHEIRTPLNGLVAVGQLLEDTALNRIQRDYVTTIRSSGETLQALISDILVGQCRLKPRGYARTKRAASGDSHTEYLGESLARGQI